VNLLYIAGLLSLVLSGAGALSFDRMRAHGATAGPVEPRRPTAAD
jgi:hypothetical protein